MSRYWLYKTILMLFGLMQTAMAVDQTSYHVQADLYSEPLPIHSFIDGWNHPQLDAGKVAFAQGHMELRHQHDQLQYGLSWNYDYLIKFTPDTARLYYQIENDLPLDAHKNYDLAIDAQHIETVGFRLGKVWQYNPDWQFTTGISLLQGRHFLVGEISGQGVTGVAAQKMLDQVRNVQANINYYYDQPALHEDELGWQPKAPTGYGLALDIALAGQLTDELSVTANLRNAVGYMRWDKAPNTRYQASYVPERLPSFDVQGQLKDNELLSQRIPYQFEGSIAYQALAQPWIFSVSSLANQYKQLWQLNSFYQNPSYQLGMHIEPQTKSYGLSLQHQNVGFRYMADHLNTNQAKRLSASLYGIYAW